MTDKYKNKYRIASTRLPNWDYSNDGEYFIIICTHNRERFFGEIENGKMILSEIGKMAEKYWYEIPQHFPFVKLDAFVVMPNHIHGIIIIDKKTNNNGIVDGDNDGNGGNGNDGRTVETQPQPPQPQPPQPQPLQPQPLQPQPSQPPSSQPQPSKNKFGPQSQNLASIVRGYKIGVTKNAKKINPLWQSRYNDHIIRDDKSYERIKNYIINNPVKWNDDKFNNIDNE